MAESAGSNSLKGVFPASTDEMKMHVSEDVMMVNEVVERTVALLALSSSRLSALWFMSVFSESFGD